LLHFQTARRKGKEKKVRKMPYSLTEYETFGSKYLKAEENCMMRLNIWLQMGWYSYYYMGVEESDVKGYISFIWFRI
jgi:hypothetical protein